MADQAQFDHDRLGHLLEDRLLMVPRFQRSYAWDVSNVDEYLNDLTAARAAGREYFMGTVVLADATETPRQLIVDGQQRLTTTALLLIAVRDRLAELGRSQDAKSVSERFLKRYELGEEEELTRLVLSPADLPDYDALVDGEALESETPLALSFEECRRHVAGLAPSPDDADELIRLIKQLSEEVQILLAVASGIPEAYVIFETLNDRGADLTTADLLKNFLFSQSTPESVDYIQAAWTEISAAFERPGDLVKFIRYDHSSRYGQVTNRKLYRSLQDHIGPGSGSSKSYVKGLKKSLHIYTALRDPEHKRWSSLNYDVRDSLRAFRRFGFESSLPLLLAVFREWGDVRAGKLLNLVADWSVRALMAKRLGGGLAEETFSAAAVAVSSGTATTQSQVRSLVSPLVPTDAEFRQAFQSFGSVTTTRAKYFLGMLEQAHRRKKNLPSAPDWSAKTVTIEHILANSSDASSFSDQEEFERFNAVSNRLWNFTLLERNLNKQADDLPFADKQELYTKSGFAMTKQLGKRPGFTVADAEARASELANLAVAAWRR